MVGEERKKHGEKIISDDGFGIRSSDVKSKGGKGLLITSGQYRRAASKCYCVEV